MADLKIARLTENLTVSAQPGREDFAALAARGVKTVINNRPDAEQPGQLSAVDGARLAAENRMDYRHIPVTLQNMSDGDVRAFAGAVSQAKGAVHAHCRSGVRSATLWAVSEVAAGRLDKASAKDAIEAAGYDATAVMAWLAAHPAS